MNRQILRALVVAAMIGAAAAPAMAQVKAVIGLSGGQIHIDSQPDDTELDLLGAHASVSAPFGKDGLVVQGDLALNSVDGDIDNDVVRGTAHLGWQNSDYAFGAYAGMTDSVAAGDTATLVGGEFVMFMSRMTFSVGGGFATSDAPQNISRSGIEAEGRYFVNDNLRLDARVGFNRLSAGSVATGYGYGIGAEWKPASSPASFFASLDSTSIDQPGADPDVAVLRIGVNFALGNPILKTRDRSGPVFKSAAGFGSGMGTVF